MNNITVRLTRGVAAILLAVSMCIVPAERAFADTWLCNSQNSTSFSVCINAGYTAHGYENHNFTSYWSASVIYPYGHNCTNYIGYMLYTNGAGTGHGAMGNAGQWDDTIRQHDGDPGEDDWGYLINGTPAVGSIALWDYGTSGVGHVAYVEEVVNSTTIKISEDNAPTYNSFRWRTVTTSGDWPDKFLHIKDVAPQPPDSDGDGTIDTDDLLPLVPGPSNNRGAPLQPTRLSGDFNGDGNQDITVLYNYPGSRTKLLTFFGDGTGDFAEPVITWDSGAGNWNWTKSKPVTGDFNSDGVSDVGVFYDYGNKQTKLWIFLGTSTGNFATPTVVFDSGINSWTWSKILPIVGDFNGDGDQDIDVMYDYPNSQTKILTFVGDGTGSFPAPVVAWDSGAGNWNWKRIKPTVGDFNGDSRTDVAVLYNYDNDHTKLITFNGVSNNTFTTPVIKWDSAVGSWDWDRTTQLSGDFNGDGYDDVGAIYNYPGSQTKLLSFLGDGTGDFANPGIAWASNVGAWNWNRVKPLTGDFNGDSKTDVATLYNYGSDHIRVFTFDGVSDGTFNAPIERWESIVGNWDWDRTLNL